PCQTASASSGRKWLDSTALTTEAMRVIGTNADSNRTVVEKNVGSTSSETIPATSARAKSVAAFTAVNSVSGVTAAKSGSEKSPCGPRKASQTSMLLGSGLILDVPLSPRCGFHRRSERESADRCMTAGYTGVHGHRSGQIPHTQQRIPGRLHRHPGRGAGNRSDDGSAVRGHRDHLHRTRPVPVAGARTDRAVV